MIKNQWYAVLDAKELKKSELSMGEKLIQGDLPILEFRKRREALKK